MSLISIQNMSFYYEGSYDYIFKDVSFQFDTSFRSALMGRNGCGKTTFLKLLMGEYVYQGKIIIQEQCSYFPYDVLYPYQKTIDVCLQIEPDMEVWQLEKELSLLAMDSQDILYRSFESLSFGEQTKVLLAILFLKKNTFLLIDEPTNHLDQEARKCVSQYLKRQKGFLLVSHDRYFIDECCDHVIAIKKTKIECLQGNFSSWYQNKIAQDEREKRQYTKLKKDINRLEKSQRQSSSWSYQKEKTKNAHGKRQSEVKPDKGYIGHRAAKLMKRSKSIEKRKNQNREEKQSLLKDVEEYNDLKMFPLTYFQSQLVQLSHVSIAYQDRIIINDLSMTICMGERILLKGHNGSGKSSLIRLIVNKTSQDGIEINHQLKISYVPQDCSYLQGDLDDLIESYHLDCSLVKSILIQFGLTKDHFYKPLQHYSLGQKKKVMLAISIASSSHLYIWDEPLNYIDIFSRIQLERLILKYQPTLLFVEHDQYFQENIATNSIDLGELI